MADFLHFYSTTGRGISSVPLGQRTLTPAVPAGDATQVAFQCYPLGYPLVLWNAEERAGLTQGEGGEHIVRIKSVDFVRDMKPIGATMLMTSLRRDGVRIEPLTGMAAASYEEALQLLSEI